MDEKEFEAWLEGQDQETYKLLSARHALRCLSLAEDFNLRQDNDFWDEVVLVNSRIVLTLGVLSRFNQWIGLHLVSDWAKTTVDTLYKGYNYPEYMLGIVATASIHDSYDAVNSTEFPSRIPLILGEMESIDRKLRLLFFEDASELRTGIPFSDGSRFSDGSGFAHDLSNLLFAPLWREYGSGASSAVSKNPYVADRTKTWAFWREWYQGFLDGEPMDWELQRRVALIPDEDWEEGPEHIAGVIEGIRRAFESKPLDSTQVENQAKRLIARPETTALITTAIADQIDQATAQFFADAKVNELPESLEPLTHLPPVLRKIARIVQSDRKHIAELEAQITELVATVQALNTALEKAKGRPLRRLAAETFVKTSVTIATTTFWGSIAAGISHVTGVVDVGNLLERLSGLASEMPQVIEPLSVPASPPVEI